MNIVVFKILKNLFKRRKCIACSNNKLVAYGREKSSDLKQSWLDCTNSNDIPNGHQCEKSEEAVLNCV